MGEAAPNRAPALAASAALHAAILLAAIIVWPHKPVQVSEVVSVNLVTSNELADMRGAIAAPTPQTAATPEPVTQAPAQTAAPVETPTPLPTPTPPQPKPAPTPAKPTPTKAAPAPTKPAPAAKTAPTSSFDPDAVLASLDKSAKATGSKRSSANRGQTRPETAVVARLANGSGNAAAASAVNNIGVAIQKVWRPNCGVAGASDASITVTFTLGSNGKVSGDGPKSSADGTSDPVLSAFSDRAKSAIYHAQPFAGLPPSLYNQPIELKFSGRAACAE